ncbi:MAG: hypothetical protein ABIK92_16230 [Pseudomonadota bacterium]
MRGLKLFNLRKKQRSTKYFLILAILIGFLTIHISGCGNNAGNNSIEFKKVDGRVEPLNHQTISEPFVTLALKREIYLPYLEVGARLAPPFELPRRLQGGALRFRVQSVKTQGNLDIYDKDHAMEKNIFANVIWLNFDESKELWSGSRQIYLSDFNTIPLENISGVEGTLLLRVPVDPVTVEFNLKNYAGRYEVNGVRFEIKHLSPKKVELLIHGNDENYMGMDALVKGAWLRTLGLGHSFTKTSQDQIVIEEHQISVNFPQSVEAIKLYFCAGYNSVESEILIRPDKVFTKSLD